MSTTEHVSTDTLGDARPTDQSAAGPRTETVTWSADAAPYPTSSVRKIALFRETADGWILQHVRTVTVSQRAESGCTIDTELALEDLPASVRASLPDDVREVSNRA